MAETDTRGVTTAQDVARLAGTSQSAVSRAFTPGASVSAALRRKILTAAEQLGYQPNQIARSLTSGRSNIVGVGISSLDNPFFTATLQTMSAKLAAAGLRLLLFTAVGDTAGETPIQEVLQYRLDALVLLSTSLSSRLAEQCQRANVPVVLYNRTSADSDSVCSVTGNNFGGAQSIAAFLLAGGHQHLAFIAGTPESSTSRDREAGFVNYLAEHGATAITRDCGHFTRDGAAAAARRLLSAKRRPDAIFCANDEMAIAAIEVAQCEFGLAVGREVSIVGFDDIPMAAWPTFSLTTFAQSFDQMVERTVEIIQDIRTGRSEAVHCVVDGSLVLRGSARRPEAQQRRREY